jgi:hypothetical protein
MQDGGALCHPFNVGSPRPVLYPPAVRRSPLIALALGLCAGCGGGGSTPPTTASAPPPAGSLAALIGLPGTSKAVQTTDLLITSGRDFVTGSQRAGIAVLAKDGSIVSPDGGAIDVYVAADALAPALGPFHAVYEPLGVDPKTSPLKGVFVAHLEIPKDGSYFLATRFTVNGKPFQASGGIAVATTAATPAIGAPAPASDTPTLASTHGNLKALTTASPPDTSLLVYSIRESLSAHKPFVAVFATPLYCTSRLCGPTVDVALAAQAQLKGTSVRFIHVEIDKDLDPAKGPNAWVTEWGLPSEPWVFVVGADGKLAAKFEGAVSVGEVVAAANAVAG